MRPAPLAVILGLSLAGAAFAADMSVRDQMKTVVEPGASTLFAVGGEVDPANGPDAATVPEARWDEALKAAKALKGVGADLTGSQKKPGEEWAKAAADFATLADDAVKAATKKDGAGFSKAANDLGDTCTACHSKYKKQG
ncbi:cytochrome c [Phenylobacterium sp.]|uniref:cytochrome c n=1 Tax=Phenylobacterium sp. TaxID=1871053 RepID=UPI00374C89F5